MSGYAPGALLDAEQRLELRWRLPVDRDVAVQATNDANTVWGQVGVASTQDQAERGDFDVWTSGVVNGAACAYDGPRQKAVYACVRAWRSGESQDDAVWSAPHRLRFAEDACGVLGQWIGSDEVLWADPAPTGYRWIRAPKDVAKDAAKDAAFKAQDTGAGVAGYCAGFTLPAGYPRCYGGIWIATTQPCTIHLNDGEPIRFDPNAETTGIPGVVLDAKGKVSGAVGGSGGGHMVRVRLPWDKMQAGENQIDIRFDQSQAAAGGPVPELCAAVRIHAAEHGFTDRVTDGDWRVIVPADTPQAPYVDVVDRAAPDLMYNAERRSIDLFRAFELDQPVASAELAIAGLGLYQASLNGQPVGQPGLRPGWTTYDERLEYAVFDVTSELRAGENRLQIGLGNGWWSSGMGWANDHRRALPDQPLMAAAKLTVQLADGRRQVIETDADWHWKPAAILCDTLYQGEVFDAGLASGPRALTDASARAVKPVDPPTRKLVPERSPAVQVVNAIKPVSVSPAGQDAQGTPRWVFDFGQNHAGRCRLQVPGGVPAGTKIKIRHAEILEPDGSLYVENYRTAEATDTYIANGDAVDWTPRFTYRGFRYAEVTGLPASIEPGLDTLISQQLRNAVDGTGRFESGNALLNDIWKIVDWGLQSNLHSVPTDCPQRDERLGWTGDVQLFAPTSCWVMDLHAFYRKWLTDLLDARCADGGIDHIAPACVDVVTGSASAWGDIITVLPVVLDRFYDDEEALVLAYPAMQGWVDWMRAHADDDGLFHEAGFGDWVPVEETPSPYCSGAYHAYSLALTAQVAERLGRATEAEAYRKEGAAVTDAFNQRYFDAAAKRYTIQTQTGQLLPLAFGLVPSGDGDLQQAVAAALVERVEQAGAKLSTGFIGTAYLLPVLSRYGYHELAYRVLNTREYPSLGYMIDQGATTVWERWNSDKMGPDMNSRNHFCFGAMAQWLVEDLVGLKPLADGPGFARVGFRPAPVGDLQTASFVYESPRGPIRAAWARADDGIDLTLDVPPGVQVELDRSGLPEKATVRLNGKALT